MKHKIRFFLIENQRCSYYSLLIIPWAVKHWDQNTESQWTRIISVWSMKCNLCKLWIKSNQFTDKIWFKRVIHSWIRHCFVSTIQRLHQEELGKIYSIKISLNNKLNFSLYALVDLEWIAWVVWATFMTLLRCFTTFLKLENPS